MIRWLSSILNKMKPVEKCTFMCFQEFPFFTMTKYPSGVLQRISMVVCARSVKLLEKVHNQGRWLRMFTD